MISMGNRKKGIRHFKIGGVKQAFVLHSIVNQFEAAKRKERLRTNYYVRTLQKTVITGIMYQTEIWIRRKNGEADLKARGRDDASLAGTVADEEGGVW